MAREQCMLPLNLRSGAGSLGGASLVGADGNPVAARLAGVLDVGVRLKVGGLCCLVGVIA